MKTYSAKPVEIEKKWLLIDAKDLVLGRLASEVATLLRGKHKATYTPHMDCGDHVVIVNAADIHLSGKKMDRKDGKIYYRHTGFPGGIKETTAGKILAGEFPERVVKMAIKRMISRNKLGAKQISNLHVYAGSEHPHQGQKPEIYDFAKKNPKNNKVRK
ncbi:MAG: 50S ribosomal protein L13 [Rickettsiaceae bacterium]|nr:50S ribosomal protein L13 [Rickettsiaceae bacterium]